MKTYRSPAAASLRHIADHAAIVRQPSLAYARIEEPAATADYSDHNHSQQRAVQREAMEHVSMLLESDRRRTRNRLLLAAGLLLSLVLLASQRTEEPAAFSEDIGQTAPMINSTGSEFAKV